MRLLFFPALLWITLMGLSGCSGPQQDVRVSFCKDMVAAHLDALDSIWWVADDSEIKRPEYARIDLSFNIGNAAKDVPPRRASCLYEYDATDENVITHTDPLAAYATTPYQMLVDGQRVAEPVLNQLITDVGLLQAGNFLDRFWQWWEEIFSQL